MGDWIGNILGALTLLCIVAFLIVRMGPDETDLDWDDEETP